MGGAGQGDGLRSPFGLHFDPAMDEARSVPARSGFLPQQPRDQCALLLQAQRDTLVDMTHRVFLISQRSRSIRASSSDSVN